MPDHATAGASILRDLDFPRVAEIVGKHMNLNGLNEAVITETEIVYIADKLVQAGGRATSLESRFEEKLLRFGHDPEARRAIAVRQEHALRIRRALEARLGALEPLPIETDSPVDGSFISELLHLTGYTEANNSRERDARWKKLIYLPRHGAIELPRAKAMVGQIDLPLSVEGIRQASGGAMFLPQLSAHGFIPATSFVSYRMAKIIAREHQELIEPLPKLREINLGEWEGLSRDTVEEQFSKEWEERQQNVTAHQPPGGRALLI